MSRIRINWVGYCDACGSAELDVYTDMGTSEFLYAGDGVVCTECGAKGLIECEDDSAFVVWDE